jgi:hypothetical protein
VCVDDFSFIACTSTDCLLYFFAEHPNCVWNIVDTHPDDCDPDNRIRGHLSKENQQSLEYITESPIPVAEGEPVIHTFDVGNRIMIGDIVVVYGDVH